MKEICLKMKDFPSPCVDPFFRHLPGWAAEWIAFLLGSNLERACCLDVFVDFWLINRGCVFLALALTFAQRALARGVAGWFLLRLISLPLTARPGTRSDTKSIYTRSCSLSPGCVPNHISLTSCDWLRPNNHAKVLNTLSHVHSHVKVYFWTSSELQIQELVIREICD